ncbi:hypothetical protein GCM10009760_63920 [Kitasatospora kazusensis]|uniref:Uncharacterized protein n=1 Tax=Kitasatospora kazusensis TaxID=407974 RepID=A0ABP4KEF1_9ACTN
MALEGTLYANPDMPAAGHAAQLLAGVMPPLTRRPPSGISAWARANVDLAPPDRLGFLIATTYRTTRGWAAASFDELRTEPASVMSDIPKKIPDPLAQSRVRGQVFSTFEPLLFDLLRAGDHRLLWEWLGTWRGADSSQ